MSAAEIRDENNVEDVPSGYHWIRFKWMIWLGCCRHWRKRWQFLLAILMPSILSLIVILLRVEISVEYITANSSPGIDLQDSWNRLLKTINDRHRIISKLFGTPTYSPFTPRTIIGYAPDTAFNNIIMAQVYWSLRNITRKEFKTCNELREKMSTEYYLAGVCFSEGKRDREIAVQTRRFDIRLIFPSELRIYRREIGETWDTSNLYKSPELYEHKHGFMTYIDEGFILLQKLISETYIQMLMAGKLRTKFFLRKFSATEHYYDPVSVELQMRLSLLLVLGYMTTVAHLLRALVIEREKKLDGLMAILDVAPFIQFYSWFVFTFLSMTVGSLVLLLVLKIPFNNGFAVLNRATCTCLFTVFTAFNIYALSFCYMISKFFRKPKVAVSAAPIFWMLFYLPFASTVDSTSNLRHTLHPLISLFGSSAFGFAIQRINSLENDEGLHWSNFFQSTDLAQKGYSVGTYTLILCGISIVQSVIGISVPKVEKFFKKLIQKIKDRKNEARDSTATRYSKTIILELRANDKPSALEVIALTVTAGNEIILDDISFSLYEDEITMLMGHNGSGKTTLIQVLAGIRTHQSGKIIYPGTNDNESVTGTSDFIGVCFSDTLLFHNLSVGQQLMFFGHVKGLGMTELEKEMEKYLEALQLKHCRYMITDSLTCGQRTKLAVACALIGGSKVILLDDIVLKLNVYDNELVWNLLETEKFGRIILATTNLSLAMEMHADNLVILGQGRLKCVGSGQFLKSIYCFGCHVLICKDEISSNENVTKIFTKYIRDLTPSAEIGRELTYTIESSKIKFMQSILKELELNKKRLKILNIIVIETPVEELFCKLGAERSAYDDRKQFMRIFNGLSMISEEDDEFVFLKKRINHQMSKFQKIVNQWFALLYKYGIFYWVHKSILIIYIFLPLFFIVYFAITIMPEQVNNGAVLKFDIGDYDDAKNLISSHKDASDAELKYIEGYKQYIYWKNSNIKMITVKDEPIINYVNNEQRNNENGILNLKTMLALASHDTNIVGWFNGYLPHIAPVALNLLYNGYIRAFVSTEARMDISLEVLPWKEEVSVNELSKVAFNTGSKLGLCISFVTCYLVSFQIFILVEERTNGFKDLQSLAGVSSFNYWMGLFIFDLIKYLPVVMVCSAALWLLYPHKYMSAYVIGYFFKMLLLLCAALNSTNCLLTFFYKKSHRAFLLITTLQCVGLVFFVAFHGDLEDKAIHLLPRIFPLYNFCMGFHKFFEGNVLKVLCEDEMVNHLSVALEQCKILPNCCGFFIKLLLLLCAALNSTNYLLSLFFKSPHRAYFFITTLQCMGLHFFIACFGDLEDKTISMMPRIFPLYNFCIGLKDIYEEDVRKVLCDDEMVNHLSVASEQCKILPNCCDPDKGRGERDAMYLWLIIINSWIAIFMYECRGFFKSEIPIDNYERALDEHIRRHASESNEMDNVTAEMIRVRTMKPQKRYSCNATCENLGLIQDGKILVDRVSLIMERGDILGLVGTNCVNTRALLDLLVGSHRPTFGRLYINGISMTSNHEKAKKLIGHVPTSCGIMGEMTCYQALKIFCILYGYERDDIEEICENLSKNLGFHTYYHTRLKKCSTGIKDRISYSIAVLKKPTLLCIDNYILSVDPIGRRQWSRLLVNLCAKVGTSIAITSVYNCYTEIICNRIVIMKEGQFTHIGHPSKIAPKLSDGYVITMRMKKNIQTLQGVVPKVFFRLTAFMEEIFPGSQALNVGTVMQYYVPHQSSTLSYIYTNLHENLFKLNIDTFLITSMDLNYVFGRIEENATRRYNHENGEASRISFFNNAMR